MFESLFNLRQSASYDVTTNHGIWQKFRGLCRTITVSKQFTFFIMSVILLNMICMGLEHYNQVCIKYFSRLQWFTRSRDHNRQIYQQGKHQPDKTVDISRRHHLFPSEMSCHYPDLGGATDWSFRERNLLQPINQSTNMFSCLSFLWFLE